MKTKEEKHWSSNTLDLGFDVRHHPPVISNLLDKWKKERGYHWHENPKARFHANGKYATGIYK